MVNFFEQENNFESKIKEAVNLEMEVTSTLPKMEYYAQEKELKDRLKSFRNKANIQLQRLEDLCDIYDIPLLGRSSIDVESIINEMEITEAKSRGQAFSKKDILETAKELEAKEQLVLQNALKMARELGYQEAVDILNVSVSSPQYFGEAIKNS